MFTLDPNSATFVGAVGHDDRLTDNSPEGHEARAELLRRTLVRAGRAERERRDG